MAALSVFVLIALNYGVYEKEQIKKHGETLFLELAPVDPRSLMQGDYMQLRYAIADHASVSRSSYDEKRGYLVIRTNAQNVAQFVRFHDGENLAAGEKLFPFHQQYGRVIINPGSFFFQEGHAEYYENSKYGIFKFEGADKRLLIGLADSNQEKITAIDL